MRALTYTYNACENRRHRQHQQDSCQRRAQDKGYTVIGTVHDEGTSRPELDRLLIRARDGEFDVLVITDLARLGRRYPAVQALLDELDAEGITLDVCDQPPSPDSHLQLMAAIAAFDNAARMSKRIRAWKTG